MKIILLFAIPIFWTSLSFGQISKEEQFVKTAMDVVHKLSESDSVSLSEFIDKKTGIYILYSAGVRRTYVHNYKINYSVPFNGNMAYAPFFERFDKVKFTKIEYSSLPNKDCEGSSKWSKTGAFVDTTKTDHSLSDIAKQLNKIQHEENEGAHLGRYDQEETISQKIISDCINLELKSRKIVIVENNGNSLIIFLSYIENVWRLTIIDSISYCEA